MIYFLLAECIVGALIVHFDKSPARRFGFWMIGAAAITVVMMIVTGDAA